MRDGKPTNVVELEAHRRNHDTDAAADLQAVRNVFDALEADPEDDDPPQAVILLNGMVDLLERTTEHPTRDSLIAMLGAVIGIHAQYSGVEGGLIDTRPETVSRWLEAIEAADPAIARFTRALDGDNA